MFRIMHFFRNRMWLKTKIYFQRKYILYKTQKIRCITSAVRFVIENYTFINDILKVIKNTLKYDSGLK